MDTHETALDLTRAAWRKSTYSGGNGGECVEFAPNLPGVVLVRDSKDPDGAKLSFPRSTWAAFVNDLKDGQLQG